MPKQKLRENEKDYLIEIMQDNINAKADLINQLTSDLVFANHQIYERDKIFQQIKDMI